MAELEVGDIVTMDPQWRKNNSMPIVSMLDKRTLVVISTGISDATGAPVAQVADYDTGEVITGSSSVFSGWGQAWFVKNEFLTAARKILKTHGSANL